MARYGGKMGKFLSNMIELGFNALINIPFSKKKTLKAKETLERLIIDNEEIDIEEFLEMYDTRIYNFDSKQYDIKILKRADFEGVYIIHNCTKDIYLVGKSQKVLKKVDRYFRGFENEDVYEDYENCDTFKIRIIKLENSDYNDIDELEKDMKEKYGTYIYKENIVSTSEKNNEFKLDFLAFVISITIIAFGFFMLYLYSIPKEGEAKVTINAKDYIGVNYEEVEEKFKDMGFTNIQSIPKEDLITGWMNKDGETDKITINNNSKFEKDEIFSKDAEIIITYHSFKE